ncbi:hypothetical protein HAX54_020137, partial [Datura stramonium]|nr:hypothetical protein [Datura stramonium]
DPSNKRSITIRALKEVHLPFDPVGVANFMKHLFTEMDVVPFECLLNEGMQAKTRANALMSEVLHKMVAKKLIL